MEIILNLANQLPMFAVVFFRTAGLLVFAPIFKHEVLPRQLKIALSLIVTFVIYPTVDTSAVTLPTSFWPFLIIAVKEAVLGVTVGFGANIIFSTFFVAGDLMGRQMGMQMGSVVDPQLQKTNTSFSAFLYIIVSLVFLSLNGHHWFIKAISTSYSYIPIGQINYTAAIVNRVAYLFKTYFSTGVSLAMPCIVILMLALTALGLTARVAPQVNVFFLAFPIKSLLGFAVIIMSFPFIMQTIRSILFSLQREIPTILATVK